MKLVCKAYLEQPYSGGLAVGIFGNETTHFKSRQKTENTQLE